MPLTQSKQRCNISQRGSGESTERGSRTIEKKKKKGVEKKGRKQVGLKTIFSLLPLFVDAETSKEARRTKEGKEILHQYRDGTHVCHSRGTVQPKRKKNKNKNRQKTERDTHKKKRERGKVGQSQNTKNKRKKKNTEGKHAAIMFLARRGGCKSREKGDLHVGLFSSSPWLRSSLSFPSYLVRADVEELQKKTDDVLHPSVKLLQLSVCSVVLCSVV